MTTTAMTALPGQRFIGLPSGSDYKADNSGNIAAVQTKDVVAMLNAGAQIASTGTTAPTRQTVTSSTNINAATTDVDINQTASSTYVLAGGWANDGFEIKIKDVGANLSATNTATFTPPSGATIDGQASYVMPVASEGVKLKWNANTHNVEVFG